MAKALKHAVDDLPDLGGKTKQPRKKRGRVKMKAPLMANVSAHAAVASPAEHVDVDADAGDADRRDESQTASSSSGPQSSSEGEFTASDAAHEPTKVVPRWPKSSAPPPASSTSPTLASSAHPLAASEATAAPSAPPPPPAAPAGAPVAPGSSASGAPPAASSAPPPTTSTSTSASSAPPPSSLDPPPAPSPSPSDHRFWWLTRTNRRSTCFTCRGEIVARNFRVLFHPDPAGVPDLRVWRHTFWRYFHISRNCLPLGSEAPVPSLDNVTVDIAPLPRACHESAEARATATQAALDFFFEEHAAVRAR